MKLLGTYNPNTAEIFLLLKLYVRVKPSLSEISRKVGREIIWKGFEVKFRFFRKLVEPFIINSYISLASLSLLH